MWGCSVSEREGEGEEVMWQKKIVTCGTHMCHISETALQTALDWSRGVICLVLRDEGV